ncbi:hypothetical protein [Paenibacillus planticolens]|nr:hypothetical protein [Paenibacillus planticolens]
MIDPYFNDIPWEIVYDDSGRIIGEIYLIKGANADGKDWGRKKRDTRTQ